MRILPSNIPEIAALLGATSLSSIKNVPSLGAYALILKNQRLRLKQPAWGLDPNGNSFLC